MPEELPASYKDHASVCSAVYLKHDMTGGKEIFRFLSTREKYYNVRRFSIFIF